MVPGARPSIFAGWADVYRRWWSRVPGRCLLCLAPCRAPELCCGCMGDLARTRGGRPARLPWTSGIEVPFGYTYPLDHLVQAFKFHRDLAALTVCSSLLKSNVSDYSQWADRVVAIPLSRSRYARRGFNQAAVLAAAVAAEQGMYFDGEALRRRRGGIAQSRLPAATRRANVRDAFAASSHVRGQRILLVDDVVTTGATVSEAARTLVRAGAREVRIVALAFSERP